MVFLRMPIDLYAQFASATPQQALDAIDNFPGGQHWTDESGRTPLALAAMRNRPDLVEALVKHGADVEAVDQDGRTPILLAAVRGHYEVIKALSRAGANPLASSPDGANGVLLSLAHTKSKSALNCFNFFMDACPGHDMVYQQIAGLGLLDYLWDDDTKIVKTLAKRYGPQFFNGFSAPDVFRVAESGRHALLHALIDGGLSVHIRDHEQNTLLMSVLANCDYPSKPSRLKKVMELLISKEMDVLAKNASGQDLTDIVAENKELPKAFKNLIMDYHARAKAKRCRAELQAHVRGEHPSHGPTRL